MLFFLIQVHDLLTLRSCVRGFHAYVHTTYIHAYIQDPRATSPFRGKVCFVHSIFKVCLRQKNQSRFFIRELSHTSSSPSSRPHQLQLSKSAKRFVKGLHFFSFFQIFLFFIHVLLFRRFLFTFLMYLICFIPSLTLDVNVLRAEKKIETKAHI